MLTITLNGASHTCQVEQPKLVDLLAELNLAGKRLAIEKNGEIIPRSLYEQTALADGDCLEIVVAVGGG